MSKRPPAPIPVPRQARVAKPHRPVLGPDPRSAATPGSWIIETDGGAGGGGGGGGDVTGPVTAIDQAGETGARTVDTDRLVHLTLGFVPTVPIPQNVTYLVSSDDGATWVWIGAQRMQKPGQKLLFDRLAPGQDSTWKIAAVSGNPGGSPTPVLDADLDAMYPGILRSASFPIAGLAVPPNNQGITATIGACLNIISADGFTQFGRIPGVSYTDPVNSLDFFVRITVQNLDSSHNPLTPEQVYGGSQITGTGHTENDLLVTYIPNLAFECFRFYVANRNSQGSGDFIDPTSNTNQLVTYNGITPTALLYNVPIVIPPFTPIDPGLVFNVTSVTASEVGPKYQDQRQGLHTVIGVVPVIDHDYSSPRTVTIWFDFGDGTPVWQGWYALTSLGEVVRIGDATMGTEGVTQAGNIWVPANAAHGNWRVWCGSGRIDSGVNPNAYVTASFPVTPVSACSPSGTTAAQFLNDPKTGLPIVYSKYDPGVWKWEYYELTWQPPTLAQEPNYWFTLITVQKGATIAGVWTPAPDAEGRNDDPTGQYIGRVHDEVVLAPGQNPTAVSVMRKFGSNPATWDIPPAQNPDLTANVYREFRFLIYNVSRLATDASGSGGAGTYTQQTICWPGGTSFFILIPSPQAAVLDIRAANPATITLPLTGGNGLPLTVGPGTISSAYIGAQAVQANNMAANAITVANGALAAQSVVDANITTVGINKVTYGTSVFAGDVVLTRGIGQPVIYLKAATSGPDPAQNPSGVYLFAQGDATSGVTGLTSHPYAVFQAAGLSFFSGGTGPQILLNSGGLTIWSVQGDSSHAFFTVTSLALTFENGPNSVTINSNALAFVDGFNNNRLDMNSAGISVQNSSNRLVIIANAIQLQLGGSPRVTIDTTNGITLSNGGASSIVISATAATITNGTFHFTSGGVTVDISPSASTPGGNIAGLAVNNGIDWATVTSSAFFVTGSGGTGGPYCDLARTGLVLSNGVLLQSILTYNSLQMTGLPSSSPGTGSKQFWYDPADGNRVKFAA